MLKSRVGLKATADIPKSMDRWILAALEVPIIATSGTAVLGSQDVPAKLNLAEWLIDLTGN
jgi:hypothetical protein